jgi:hypothetical protein
MQWHHGDLPNSKFYIFLGISQQGFWTLKVNKREGSYLEWAFPFPIWITLFTDLPQMANTLIFVREIPFGKPTNNFEDHYPFYDTLKLANQIDKNSGISISFHQVN